MRTTPGPWRLFNGPGDACGIGPSARSIICEMRRMRPIHWDSRDSDARLIAAAPDLYRELVAALAEHAAKQHMGADCECEACDRRRALLDRIEGNPVGAHMTQGQVYATCRCCGRSNVSVEYRPRNAPRQTQRCLCEACWNDPSLTDVDCHHGLAKIEGKEST